MNQIYKRMEMPQYNEEKTKRKEEIKDYLRNNLEISGDFREGKYYLTLSLEGEKFIDFLDIRESWKDMTYEEDL